jgi:hypothetical protein
MTTAHQLRTHPRFKWWDGIAYVTPDGRRGRIADGGENEPPADAVPDLTDGATIGVLEELVYERFGDRAHLTYRHDGFRPLAQVVEYGRPNDARVVRWSTFLPVMATAPTRGEMAARTLMAWWSAAFWTE